jgi:hypothetical protein
VSVAGHKPGHISNEPGRFAALQIIALTLRIAIPARVFDVYGANGGSLHPIRSSLSQHFNSPRLCFTRSNTEQTDHQICTDRNEFYRSCPLGLPSFLSLRSAAGSPYPTLKCQRSCLCSYPYHNPSATPHNVLPNNVTRRARQKSFEVNISSETHILSL